MPFHRARCSSSAVALLILCLTALGTVPSLAWQLSPEAGGEGTEIHLSSEAPVLAEGSDPAMVIWGEDGGAVVDDVRIVKGGLKGSLGPVADGFVGYAELCWGRRVELPHRSHQGLTGTFVTHRALWHVGKQSAGVGTFGVLGGGAIQGRLQDPDTVVIDVPPVPPEKIFLSIRVDIVIDGGSNNNQGGGSTGSGDGGSGDGTGSAGSNGRLFHAGSLFIDHVPSVVTLAGAGSGEPSADVAADLAATLDAHLADLGLRVESEGGRIFIHAPGGLIYRGFAVLSLSAS